MCQLQKLKGEDLLSKHSLLPALALEIMAFHTADFYLKEEEEKKKKQILHSEAFTFRFAV